MMKAATRGAVRPLAVLILLAGTLAHAEQKAVFGEHELHYVVFNTTFLKPEIASRYGITRGRDKALVNVSVLDGAGRAVAAPVAGKVTNLLGQERTLAFRRFDEGEAIYYLATLTYEHLEALRFEIVAELPGHGPARVRFQQTLHFEE